MVAGVCYSAELVGVLSMSDKAYIRVSVGEDGKTVTRELIYGGHKVGELSYVEVLELVMQATSSLRYDRG